MELAGEFIVMASELMLIKSRMLLPRTETEEKDPRADLADALLRYQQAKQAVTFLKPMYEKFSGRMVKDTDEITVDTSYVADQQVTSLCLAVRRMIAANESRPKAEKQVFAPMIAKPIIPVDIKIVGILQHMEKTPKPSMQELLSDAVSVPDLIAIFLGILELIKVRKILIDESPDDFIAIHGVQTRFVVNDDPDAETPEEEKVYSPKLHANDPIPLSSRAEMHREQRRILREQKLAEKKRLREEARAKRAAERAEEADRSLPPDDSDLDAQAKLEELLDNRLSEDDEDIMDDLGLDMNEILRTMAKQAEQFPKDDI